MENLRQLVKQGKQPTNADWEEYLKAYHDRYPGLTVDKITRYPCSAGCSSYEFLAQEISKVSAVNKVVVDLACGNGPLVRYCIPKIGPQGKVIAVDMSEGELNQAKKLISSRNVEFLCDKAQKLPIPSSSVDVVLCHLAFMLMKPIEPVVEEIARILKPGGLFTAVIQVLPQENTLFAKFSSLVATTLKQEYPNFPKEGIGDARTKNKDAMQSLFQGKPWNQSDSRIEDFYFLMDDTAENLWTNLRDFYLPSLLSDQAKTQLGVMVVKLFQDNRQPNGMVPFRLPARLFSMRKEKL